MVSMACLIPVLLLLNSVGATLQATTPPYPCNETTSILPSLHASGSALVGTPITQGSPTWTVPGHATWTPSGSGLPTLQSFSTSISGALDPKSESELAILASLLEAAQHCPTDGPSNSAPVGTSSPDATSGFGVRVEEICLDDSLLDRPRSVAVGAHIGVSPRNAQVTDGSSEIFGDGSEFGHNVDTLLDGPHPTPMAIVHGLDVRSTRSSGDSSDVLQHSPGLESEDYDTDDPLPSPTALLDGNQPRNAQSTNCAHEIFGCGSELEGDALNSLLDAPHPSGSAVRIDNSPRGVPPAGSSPWTPGHGSKPGFEGFINSTPNPPITHTAVASSHVSTDIDTRAKSTEDCSSTTTRTITSTEKITTTVTKTKPFSSNLQSTTAVGTAATWNDQGKYRPIVPGEIDFIKSDYFPSSTTTSTVSTRTATTSLSSNTKTVYTTITVCPHSARDVPVPVTTDRAALSVCLSSDACQPFLAHVRACFETQNPWTDPYDETKSSLFQICVCQTTASEPFDTNSPFWVSYGEAASCLSKAGVAASLVASESDDIDNFCRSQNPSAYLFIQHLQSWLAQLEQGTTLSFDPLQGAITTFVPSPQWTTTPPLANLAYGASAPEDGSLADLAPSLTTRTTTEVVGMAPNVTKVATVTELVTWLPASTTTRGDSTASTEIAAASKSPVACDDHIVCVSAASPRLALDIVHLIAFVATILGSLFGVDARVAIVCILACSSGLIIIISALRN